MRKLLWMVLLSILLLTNIYAMSSSVPEAVAASGVQGGLIVHVGCEDGGQISRLWKSDSYMVQALETDPAKISKARKLIQEAGLYGKVTVREFNGVSLPYVDNMVNLLIMPEGAGNVAQAEIMRVLTPGGTAIVGGVKTVKPVPAEIDEWTHYLHDSTGNAVAQDEVVGPPRRVQWIGSPRWARHHDRMASMTALVSSGGRMFYIFDEGSTASIMQPAKQTLIARDAFNGTILWKRSLPNWHNQLNPYKSGPAKLPRRLVAVGNRVYVTLGLSVPLTCLDAATGETIRTYEDTRATEEIIESNGTLFLITDGNPAETGNDYIPESSCMHVERDRVAEQYIWDERKQKIMAVEAASGKTLWTSEHSVVPLSIAADNRRVVFHNGSNIVCLDRINGKIAWESQPVKRKQTIPINFGPTLVLYKDYVVFSGGDRSMSALSLADGKTLWSAKHAKSGHHSPEDLMVINDLVWSGAIAGGRDSGVFTGRDLLTGEVKHEFGPDVNTYWFHQRCYRSKATEKYFLPSRTGIEFIDLKKQNWETHHWVRGGCIYGIMPCNGLVYAPPHSCSCYIDAKLNGFCALAPAQQQSGIREQKSVRLEKGPAYGAIETQISAIKSTDWPTYRGSNIRGGFTATTIPAKVKRSWTTGLDGKLSAITVANGKVFVASVDQHTVHALDEKTGDSFWEYITGGRVDSPPTIHGGLAIFGSADGWVYALRATDGELAWRFRAAPNTRQIMSFEQLESIWPVSGSVLVQDGIVSFVAGRSMYLDGGLRLIQLNAKTGEKVNEVVMDDLDPDSGKSLQTYVKALNMPTGLPDILSSDGKHLYMRTQRMDMKGNREFIKPTAVTDQQGEGVHLFSGIGFLDDSYFHRGYWTYGKSIVSGASQWFQAGKNAPGGRLLVVDDSNVYGYGRKPQYYRWATPQSHRIFSSSKQPGKTVPEKIGVLPIPKGKKKDKCVLPDSAIECNWSVDAPLQVRASLFNNLANADPLTQLTKQDAIERGSQGSKLQAISAESGKKLAELKMDELPVFDGMAVANGRLFLSTMDGKVLCFE